MQSALFQNPVAAVELLRTRILHLNLQPRFLQSSNINIIKDYQRLKTDENSRLSLEQKVKRTISKINYRIHTDAIKENLIPLCITNAQQGMTYASEVELLNVALFGKISKEWRLENPKATGNIRNYATIQQLIVLYKLRFKEEGKNSQKKNKENKNSKDIVKRAPEYAEKLSKMGKSSLSEYIVHRKSVLDLLENNLKYQDSDGSTYAYEESVHQLIFPM